MCPGQEFSGKNPFRAPPAVSPACVGQSIFLHKVYANVFTRNPHKLQCPAHSHWLGSAWLGSAARCPNKPYLADVWGSVSGPAAAGPGPGSTGSAAYFACHLRLSTLGLGSGQGCGGALRGLGRSQVGQLVCIRWTADKSSIFIGSKITQKYTLSFAFGECKGVLNPS